MSKKKKKTMFQMVLILMVLLLVIPPSFTVTSDDRGICDNNPFIYFYPPSNSFGMSSYKTVNPVFLKQLLNDNINWNLEYKRYSYSDWVEGNEYLDIDLNWMDDSFYKITLNFSCPVDVYHARFTMDFSVNVLDYIEKNDSCVWFNYSTVDGNINLMFDYSDLKSINGLYFEKGIVNDWFFFRFGRYNISSGFYSFDPIFGNDAYSQALSICTSSYIYLRGLYDTFEGGNDCYADSITTKVQNIVSDVYVSCFLYEYVDYVTYYAGDLLEETETKLLTSADNGNEVTFDLSGTYNLVDSTNYYIVICADSHPATNNIYGLGSQNNGIYKQGSEDDPLTGEGSTTVIPYLYVTYTCGGVEPCTDNCTISNLEMNGASFVNQTVDVEDCRSYWNWTIDVEDCIGDIDWINITVEGFGYTNHTNKGNGTYWHNYSGNMDCNTNYTIWINNSCQNGAVKNNYYYWFVTEACCIVSLNNVMVNGIDTNTTQYCLDYNATYLNVSYDVTSSCDNEIEFINVSFNNGSHIFYSQVTNEAEGSFWVNWSSIVFDCETNYTMLNFTIHDGDNCNDDWVNATYWFNTCDCVGESCCNYALGAVYPVNKSTCFSNSSILNFTVWLNTSCGQYNFSYVNISFGTNYSNTTNHAQGQFFGNFSLPGNLSCATNYSWYVVFNKDSVNCTEVNLSFWFKTCNCTAPEFPCNCSDFYTKEEIDNMFGDLMDITISMDGTLLFTLILFIGWMFFLSLYFKTRDVGVALAQLCFAMPLTFIIGSISSGFVLGYAVLLIVCVLGLLVTADAYFSNRKTRHRG